MKELFPGASASPRGMNASQQAEETLSRVSKLQEIRERRKSNIIEKISKQQSTIVELNARLQDTNAKLEEALAKAESTEVASAEKIDTIRREHEAEVSRYRATAAKLYEQIDDLKSEISQLKDVMSDADEKMSEAEDKIAQADQAQKSMEAKIQRIEEDAERRVERAIATTQNLIERSKSSFAVKERRLLASINSEKDAADLAKKDADRRCEKMAKLLEEERARCANLEEDKACMRHENERLGALLKRLQGTVDALLNEEMSLASDFEDVHRDLQEASEETSFLASRPSSLLKKENLASRDEVTVGTSGGAS